MHYNVAKNAADAGNRALAVERYRHALALNPSYDQAMNNLANILKDGGDFAQAEMLLKQAVQLRWDEKEMLEILCWNYVLSIC